MVFIPRSDDFITEISRLYESAQDKRSVWVTFKKCRYPLFSHVNRLWRLMHTMNQSIRCTIYSKTKIKATNWEITPRKERCTSTTSNDNFKQQTKETNFEANTRRLFGKSNRWKEENFHIGMFSTLFTRPLVTHTTHQITQKDLARFQGLIFSVFKDKFEKHLRKKNETQKPAETKPATAHAKPQTTPQKTKHN